MSEVKFDRCRRMVYHPEYHFNHKEPFTTQEVAYMCTMHGKMNLQDLGYALGRTPAAIAQRISQLKRKGLFERYRQMGG